MSAPKIDSGIFSTNIGIFGGNGGIVSPGPGNSGGSYNYQGCQVAVATATLLKCGRKKS